MTDGGLVFASDRKLLLQDVVLSGLDHDGVAELLLIDDERDRVFTRGERNLRRRGDRRHLVRVGPVEDDARPRRRVGDEETGGGLGIGGRGGWGGGGAVGRALARRAAAVLRRWGW